MTINWKIFDANKLIYIWNGILSFSRHFFTVKIFNDEIYSNVSCMFAKWYRTANFSLNIYQTCWKYIYALYTLTHACLRMLYQHCFSEICMKFENLFSLFSKVCTGHRVYFWIAEFESLVKKMELLLFLKRLCDNW